MEKLGVSNEELLIELQAEYARKLELVKTGSSKQEDLEAIKEKIHELQQGS
jgi:hypothetical protein